MNIGMVAELWRYPVKSFGGEQLDHGDIHNQGLVADRCWALQDKTSGDIVNGKHCPKILQLSARYSSGAHTGVVYGDQIASADIIFADSRVISSRDDNIHRAISEFIGREVVLAALQPPEDLEHYRLSEGAGAERASRPNLSENSSEIKHLLEQFSCPPGTYVDAYPLHMLTRTALSELQRESRGDADARRFRPNLIVESEGDTGAFPEFDWVGRGLQIGEALLKVDSRTLRCAMPARSLPQFDLPDAPEVNSTLIKLSDRFLGVNLLVVKPGKVCVGDPVLLV
ncbi:MOSC N-terminal beta barrel domain-containing protein [Halieaceae bacterium]|nr:MOSC N-terminal beta barrel domain-containing protein [Halieaceae bacterium]